MPSLSPSWRLSRASGFLYCAVMSQDHRLHARIAACASRSCGACDHSHTISSDELSLLPLTNYEALAWHSPDVNSTHAQPSSLNALLGPSKMVTLNFEQSALLEKFNGRKLSTPCTGEYNANICSTKKIKRRRENNKI